MPSPTTFPKAASRWKGLGVTPDVETPLTREALLAGKDPALDAAVAWIERRQKGQEVDQA